jgi:L-lysine 2,3-aminomutase
MNEDLRGQTVYDVIISGGEPLILSNEKLGNLLEELGKARNLRILRICTGTLFLGLPMRIDDELVDILDQFSNETGVRVTIQAHLACHEQIVPESVIAVSRLRKRGINIYTQVPIKEGINFFADDLHRTVKELALLGKKQVAIGVEPYMFIVDMHPSTNAFYVPIEPLICVWGALVESHDYPGLERPRTLSILFEGGNIILSGNTMLAMTKAVDKDRGIVTYRIPRVGPDQSNRPSIAEVFEYSEPLGPHNENPDSLGLLRERWLALRY